MAYTPYTQRSFTTRYAMVQAPEPRLDGSGMVQHDIWSQYSEDGVTWFNDKHWFIVIPASELETVLASGSNAAIGNAYKQALKNNVDTVAEPSTAKDAASIEARANANGLAMTAAAGADEFITVDLGRSYENYGVNFTL